MLANYVTKDKIIESCRTRMKNIYGYNYLLKGNTEDVGTLKFKFEDFCFSRVLNTKFRFCHSASNAFVCVSFAALFF